MANETKHTPERWRAGRTTLGALGVWVEGSKMDTPNVCEVAAVPSEKDVARARLIAAAPELLAERQAISEFLGYMEWATPEHAQELLIELRDKFYKSAAIAKATGATRD